MIFEGEPYQKLHVDSKSVAVSSALRQGLIG